MRIETGVLKFAEGSALIELGDTRVLAVASVDEGRGEGWLTAEVNQGSPRGRTAEIQQVIGRRSSRSVAMLTATSSAGYLKDKTRALEKDARACP